jgi:hypothetical protein
VSKSSDSTVERARPGALMRLVADGLAGNGLDVRLPEGQDERRLAIAGQGGRCVLAVEDTGYVEWECRPAKGGEADPQEVADLAAVLLTGRPGGRPLQTGSQERPGLTLKGAVGRELQARGLAVTLEVYPDELGFEAITEIVATTPGAAVKEEVFISDDGGVAWHRDYWPEAVAIGWEPEYHWWIVDPAKLAGDIVAKVVQAIAQGLPGGRVARTA